MIRRGGILIPALFAVACGRAAPAPDPVDLAIVGESTRLRLEDPLPATSPFFDGTQVSVVAARGETIALQVMFRGERTISASLAGIPTTLSTIVPVTVVRSSTAMWGPSRGAGHYPDRLRPLASGMSSAGPVLIELAIPRDAPPGPLSGTLTVADRSIPLSLTISPVTLPPLSDAPRVWAYYDAREVAAVVGSGDVRAAERACAAMLRAHGVMATPELTLENYADRKDAVAGSRYIPVLLPKDPSQISAAVRAWRELLAGTDQVPFAIPIDEPHGDAAYANVRALADQVRAGGGGPGQFLYAVTDIPRPAYGDAVDLYISPFAITLSGPRSPERWTYNGTPPWAGAMTVDAASPDLRTWGWIAFRYQVPVWYIWDVLYWHDRHNNKHLGKDPMGGVSNSGSLDAVTFNDGEDHGNLDGALVLPPSPGSEPSGCAPTLRLKTLRRGLQDRQLLDLLATCSDRSRADVLASELVPTALGDARKGSASSWPYDEVTWERARQRLLAELVTCFL